MRANRAKNTSPELALRKALWHSGHRGYRLHPTIKLPSGWERRQRACNAAGGVKKLTSINSVRPDIAYTSRKVAIFVMGCFRHRCPQCNYKLPKHNRKFWKAKFDRNIARDERKRQDLR